MTTALLTPKYSAKKIALRHHDSRFLSVRNDEAGQLITNNQTLMIKQRPHTITVTHQTRSPVFAILTVTSRSLRLSPGVIAVKKKLHSTLDFRTNLPFPKTIAF